MTEKAGAYIAAGVLIFGVGVMVGAKFSTPQVVTVESFAQEQRQQDGSLVLERKPEAKPRVPAAIPLWIPSGNGSRR